MRTEVGIADKSLVRRVVLALAKSVDALGRGEIERAAGSRKAAQVLDDMLLDGLITRQGDLFALDQATRDIDAWAEATGPRAFANRRDPASRQRPRTLRAGPSAALAEMSTHALTLAPPARAALSVAVRFKLQRLANLSDPAGRFPYPGIDRIAGPVREKRKIRNVLFLLAGIRIALTAAEIENALPWPIAENGVLGIMLRKGILVPATSNGEHLYALSPHLGGVDAFAESTVGDAVAHRAIDGVPPMADNGGWAARVPFVDRLRRETLITADQAQRLHAAMRRDHESFVAGVRAAGAVPVAEAQTAGVEPAKSVTDVEVDWASLESIWTDVTTTEPGTDSPAPGDRHPGHRRRR